MFLKRLYRQWRALFWATLVCILAQCFFMYKGIENVPFFLYHMYAGRHAQHDSAAVLLVKTSEGYLYNKNFSNRQEELLFNAAGYYLFLRSSARDTILPVVESRFRSRIPGRLYDLFAARLSNSSAAIDSFPAWWRRYFTGIRSAVPGPLWLVQSKVSLRPPYAKSPADSIIFLIKP